MSVLKPELVAELQLNIKNFKRDLESINDPNLDTDGFAEGYAFDAYNKALSKLNAHSEVVEMLSSFYRSIEVLQEGHPNLLSAEQSDLEFAYRTLIESAIGFGEALLEDD